MQINWLSQTRPKKADRESSLLLLQTSENTNTIKNPNPFSHFDFFFSLSPRISFPSFSFLLTGSLDETVRLWMSDELVLESTNTGHCLGVASVAAHPLGSIAASSSLDSFVRVFDVDSNTTLATLEVPPSKVWQMRFDPKGAILAVAGGGSASVKLWDTSTWELIATLSIPRLEGPKPTDKSGSKKALMENDLLVAQWMTPFLFFMYNEPIMELLLMMTVDALGSGWMLSVKEGMLWMQLWLLLFVWGLLVQLQVALVVEPLCFSG